MASAKAPKPALSPSGKRKRAAEPEDELEIDVNLPEPPSKKALRKAKKQKNKPEQDKTQTEPKDSNSSETPSAQNGTNETPPVKRSDFGIWIGNLPWAVDKPAIEAFFVINSPHIDREQITRIHMPAPAPGASNNLPIKPLNKGFAYVDFATMENLDAALALSETSLGGRKVLIKNSKDFGGRPEPAAKAEGEVTKKAENKKPNERVFVGNLGFEVTRDEVREHFEQCGEVADVFLATFEDSGKCKGYGWVTFADVEGAKAAERGWTMKQQEPDSDDEGKKAKKPRKWFVNKLHGRQLRCEFAEDKSTRYNKRFGKGRGRRDAQDDVGDVPTGPPVEAAHVENTASAPPSRKKDPRSIRPGKAHMNAPRASTGIVEATGKKIVFD